jgi:NTE family protein
MKSTTTAFVLSGGASLGSIQVGMLEALYERGIRPDLIVGASVGAVNGAFIASRTQRIETARELGEVWLGLSRARVFPLNPLTGALGFLGARRHLVPDSGLRQLIRNHMTVERLEDTTVPLHVIATDVLRGEEVRLSEGSLLDALMASAAIPGVFPPVEWDGRYLMDGGVANNTPISHAIELGADRVFVLPTGAPCDLEAPPGGALSMVVHATGLLVGRRLVQDLMQFRDRAELVVLPPPCPLDVQPTDFSRAAILIERARVDARRHLEVSARRSRPRARTAAPARSGRRSRSGPGRTSSPAASRAAGPCADRSSRPARRSRSSPARTSAGSAR